MALSIPAGAAASRRTTRPAIAESRLVRWVTTAVALAFLALFLFLPLASVFAEALRKGFAAYLASFSDPAGLAAIRLTLLVATIAVMPNASCSASSARSKSPSNRTSVAKTRRDSAR